MTISIARKAAYQNLLRIERDGSYSSELLAVRPKEMSDRDVNLIHILTLGVIRKQILLDFVINLYSNTKTVSMDVEVLVIFRLGLFQLLFMDKIPGYSAVNEAVELTKLVKKRSASGLVNAVLRKAASWNGELPEIAEIERISIETSHPLWLLQKWSDDFGMEKAAEIAYANGTEPGAAFRFTSAFDALEGSKKEEIIRIVDSRVDIRPSEVTRGGFTVERIDGTLRSFSERGYIYFQDQGSQLIGEVVIEKAGNRILDLCAAPGGKSTQIARSLNADQTLTACEIHTHRARLLRRSALRQKCSVEVVCADGTAELPFKIDCFDTILVDAPCSGTGTIRRNPEIRYRLDERDIEQLKSKQLSLLQQASKVLKAKGTIIYSTCSLEGEENEEVVLRFMDHRAGFRLEPANVAFRLHSEDGFARTFPGEKGSDGFFIACLRRL